MENTRVWSQRIDQLVQRLLKACVVQIPVAKNSSRPVVCSASRLLINSRQPSHICLFLFLLALPQATLLQTAPHASGSLATAQNEQVVRSRALAAVIPETGGR